YSPDARQCDRFSQKLPYYVALPGPDCATNTDLLCALGHRDQHYVHHSDSAHKQPGSRQRKDDHARDCRDLADDLKDPAQSADAKVVVLCRIQTAPEPHQLGDLIDHPAKRTRPGLDRDADVFDLRMISLDCGEGHNELPVFESITSEQPSRSLFHHSDDPV